MQSSTMVLFRALVMLACLVVVPLAAIFGSAFPEVVRSVLVDRLLGYAKAVQEGTPTDGAGPAYSSQTAGTSSSLEPNTTWQSSPSASEAAAWPAPSRDLQAGGSANIGLGSGGAVPASFTAPMPAPQYGVPSPPPQPQANPPSSAPAQPYVPPPAPSATYVPAPTAQVPALTGSQAAPPRPTGATEDAFTSMQRLLRQYGATYYLLETWGNEGQLYRFHCRMAVAGNSKYPRRFEATDRDALSAMRSVLGQVEAWRSGRTE